MKEKVAVATVNGKAYFLVVNELKEHNIPFISLIPGQTVPAEAKVTITTEKEKPLVGQGKILVFKDEADLEVLESEVKCILQGKENYEKIIVGLDPGQATGLVVVADGKVIEQGNCYSTKEVIDSISKVIRPVNFLLTNVTVKIGNGVPIYRELLEELDSAMPPQVVLEVVGEAGTNKPLKENRRSRKVRHISSAIRIAGRAGYIAPRRKKTTATNNPTQ
jgi:hypothetical protein